MDRRVVITGIGMVSPLGNDVKTTWDNLIAGKSGISNIESFDVMDLPATIAGEIKFGTDAHQFNPDQYIEVKEQKKMDRFIMFAVAAAEEAIKDSGWEAKTEADMERTGVIIGSGIGGLHTIESTAVAIMEKQTTRRVSPFFIPACLINLASGHVSIKYGFRGPNHAVVTACATGTHAVGDAYRLIKYNDAEVMVAGSAESAICISGMAGFCAAKTLCTSHNDSPELASRPWDKKRDGFVMGEGSGILVLEEYEHAKARGAKIYAEVVGYGLSGDAYHITSPASDSHGAILAMKNAIRNAQLDPTVIDYINAHGTSTQVGDGLEINAVKQLFGEHAYNMSISSTKSAIGHLLGAAGSVEAIFTTLALRDQVAPPTLNLDDPEDDCANLDLVAKTAKQRKIEYAMSNSFGFGGTNATIVLKHL